MSATDITIHAETVSISLEQIKGNAVCPDFNVLRIKVQTREGSTSVTVPLPDGYLPTISSNLIEAAEGVAA
jgi:hypothetical protein